jgi:hypothetical protein
MFGSTLQDNVPICVQACAAAGAEMVALRQSVASSKQIRSMFVTFLDEKPFVGSSSTVSGRRCEATCRTSPDRFEANWQASYGSWNAIRDPRTRLPNGAIEQLLLRRTQ